MINVGTLIAMLRLDSKQFNAAMATAATKMKTAGASMQRAGASMQSAGMAMLPMAAAVGGVGIAAVKSFGDFDAAMTQSLAIMSDVSDEMRVDMSNAAREMAKTTVFSAEEAAESFFFLASAGLDAEESLAALPIVASFGQAGMFDMAQATDLLTDALSALGLNAGTTEEKMEELARVGNVLVKANTLANATVEQFATSLTTEAGAAMKSFGIDVEEGVAVLAAFADQGVKGQVAGTGLSRVIRLMTTAAVKNAGAYEDLGIEVFDAAGNINKMADIIEDLENAFDGMSDEQRTISLDLIGFKAKVQGVILPLLGTSQAIRDYDAGLRNLGDTMGEIGAKQLETFNKQMGLLGSQFKDVGIELGRALVPIIQSLIPLLEGLADRLRSVVDLFASAPPWVQKLVAGFAALVVSLPVILLALGSLVQVAGFALAGLGTLAGALLPAGFIGGGFMAFIAILTGPVGIVLALGALLVAVTSFISKEGGMLENWAAGGAASFKELNDGFRLTDAALVEHAASYDMVTAAAKQFRELTGEQIPQVIRDMIIEGKPWVEILSKMGEFAGSAGRGADEMREALILASAEINKAARAANDAEAALAELEAEERALAEAEAAAARAAAEQAAALSALGIVTEEMALNQLATLKLAIESGEGSALQLRDAYEELRKKYTELNVLTPAVVGALADIQVQLGLTTPKVGELGEKIATTFDTMMSKGPPAGEALRTSLERLGITTVDIDLRMQDLRRVIGEGTLTQVEAAAQAQRFFDKLESLGRLTPELAEELKAMGAETENATGSFSEFFGVIKTGIPWLDTLISGVSKFIDSLIGGDGLSGALGGIGEAISGAFGAGGGTGGAGGILGGLLQNLGGLFGGGGGGGGATTLLTGGMDKLASFMASGGEKVATGFMSGIQGLLGSVASFMPLIGPIIAMGIGPLIGMIKGLFGPSAAELEARDISNSMNEIMTSLLSADQLAEAGGELWAQRGVAIRDAMLATGASLAQADAASARLVAASKEGPEAAQAAIDALRPVFEQVQAAMSATGLSMLELRNKVHNTAQRMGISTAEVFEQVASGVLDLSKKVAKETEDVASVAASNIEALQVAVAKAMQDSGGKMTDEIKELMNQVVIAEKAAVQSVEDVATAAANNMEALQVAVTKALTDSGGKMTDEIKDLMNQIVIAEKAAFQLVEGDAIRLADSLKSKFADLRFDVDIGWNVDDLPGGPGGGGGGGDVGFQTRPGQWLTVPGPPNQPRLIMAHGQEIVGRPGGGRGNGKGEPIVVQVFLDGEKIAENQVDVVDGIGG